MSTNEDKCENCQFYKPGICVRFPPQIYTTVLGCESSWPEVKKWDWCGEYSVKLSGRGDGWK